MEISKCYKLGLFFFFFNLRERVAKHLPTLPLAFPQVGVMRKVWHKTLAAVTERHACKGHSF